MHYPREYPELNNMSQHRRLSNRQYKFHCDCMYIAVGTRTAIDYMGRKRRRQISQAVGVQKEAHNAGWMECEMNKKASRIGENIGYI